jgi:hypothetical protein
VTAPTGRREVLLAAIREQGGEWATSRVQALYRALGWPSYRKDARADLRALAGDGHLTQRGENNARFYTLSHYAPQEG